MHTVWVRLNAVVFFGLTVLLGLSCMAAISKIGHSLSYKPGTKIEKCEYTHRRKLNETVTNDQVRPKKTIFSLVLLFLTKNNSKPHFPPIALFSLLSFCWGIHKFVHIYILCSNPYIGIEYATVIEITWWCWQSVVEFRYPCRYETSLSLECQTVICLRCGKLWNSIEEVKSDRDLGQNHWSGWRW